MKIQILGSGCATCEKLYERTKEAVKQLKMTDEVEYITDVSKLIEMGVMSSPVLAIDGQAAVVGSVPDIEKIKDLLSEENQSCCSGDGACSCKCGGNC